jgi:hypothetical protein
MRSLNNQLKYRILVNEVEYFNYATFASLWIWEVATSRFPFKCKCLTTPTDRSKAVFGIYPPEAFVLKWQHMNDMNANHFEIMNVPGHFGLFIHNGNWVRDTKNCILVGEKMVQPIFGGQWEVINSVVTLGKLEIYLDKQDSEIVFYK